MRACWLWLLCLLCVSAPAAAGVPEIPRFRLLGAGDGLPSTTIPALARDRAGYLWVATWDGLARYDGVGFKVWRHDPADPASLPGNVVQALHIDAADRVWVATENGGLSVMDGDRRGFRHYRQAEHPQMGSDDVFAITSRGSDLWFGAFGGGLHRLAADGRITRFAADADEGLPSDNVLSLAFDSKGVLWVGTMAGLARYDGQRLQRVSLPAGDGLIIYSVSAEGDAMWVGASDGVHRWSPGGQWVSPPWSPMFARPNAVIAMASDGQGEYWLASQGGLWRTEGDGAPAPVNYDAQNVGIGRVLQAVLALPDGGLWVPVPTRGLAYLHSDWRRIAAFSPAQGLGGGLYRGLSRAGTDGLWVASSTGKVERLDTRQGHVVPLAHHAELLGKLRLTSVLQDRRGQLWIGHRNGLIRTDPQTGAMTQWAHEGADAVPDTTSIDWLVEAADGTLWLATQMGSVQQRDAGSGRVLRTLVKDEEGGGLPDIEGIVAAPDGRVWLGTAQGMYCWEADAGAGRFVAVPALGSERVHAFAFEHADRLWLHRMSGVEAWRREATGWVRERSIGAAEGLPAVESTGLAVDPQRRVWLGTRRGLFRIDPNLSGSRAQLRNFGVREGLLSQELNDRGLLMTDDGLLATTAADGSVALLDTHLPDPRPVTPPLVLDSLQVSRGDDVHHLRLGAGLELQPEDHELLVGTRLLSYENPLGNRYRSWLEGFDTAWMDQGASGERVFSTLTPGRYRLRVQALDAAGNASRELELRIHVLPPWWRSAWGLALFAVIGLILLLAAAAAYRRRVRRRSAWQLAEHKREVAEQASQAKTRFLATLGHEIRTPMTGVLGMTELLQSTPLDGRQQGYADAIQRAGTHLLRLVNDALDLAKIEAGKLELQQVEFDLHALLGEVVALMGPLAGKRGLGFHDGIAAGVPRVVRGDPLRLRQILLNLLGNAIKFTEAGHVSLQARPLAPHGVRLVVGDTGPGINAEQQARLFHRFEQAEGAQTTARYGGSGLGLAICQELAAAMGGCIQIESAPGQGTRFFVELPLLQAIAGGQGQSGPSIAPAPVLAGPLEILLVEDDVTVAEVVAGLLRARGHRVTHAPHGLAALTEVAGATFDLAFLDLDLPGLDGMALARQLRQRGVTTPLIALTARTDAEAEPLARQAGFDHFLRKPVTGDMLADMAALAMGRSPLVAPEQGEGSEHP